VDLEEHTLDPLFEHRCGECGARLTEAEVRTALETKSAFLCSVHAVEQVPLDEEDEPEEA
jgi:hypothetical protein